MNTSSFSRLAPVLVLTFTAICNAQSTSLSGPYGFLISASTNDPAEGNGTAVLGVMNFDGAGNVTGTYTLQNGASGGQAAQTAAGKLTGTYSSNSDGTGSVTITLDIGIGLTFATVITDGGQALQLVGTNCSGCGGGGLGGGSITLQGTSSSTGLAQSFSGGLDISLLVNGATGTVPLSVSGVPLVPNGPLVYTATAKSGSGPAQCGNGSAGTWTSSTPSLTLVVATNASGISGDFLLVLPINICGGTQTQTLSGSITGNFGAAGATNLILHGNGALLTGIARAAYAGSLNGSYGFTLNSLPQPSATVGAMTFDGAGNVTVPKKTVGPPGTGVNLPVANANVAATYSVNPDGSGTITLSGATLAFVATDGGSGLLLLQTSGAANGATGSNVTWGTARLQ